MRRSVLIVDELLAQLPGDDPEKAVLQRRARDYSRECGCAMGGFFLVGASTLTMIYFATAGDLRLRTGIEGIVFVFLAAVIGKIVGRLIAAGRLVMLRRTLSRRLHRTELGSVFMH
jgi:hypothetical protein